MHAMPANLVWSDNDVKAVNDISTALNLLLADIFTLYLKTKNFHWHMSGPHFRDYHLMLDEQGDQLLAATDPVAERVRKIGGRTLRSIEQIAEMARLAGNEREGVLPVEMLTELCDDNRRLETWMREAHAICVGYDDAASTSLLETLLDEAERRSWFLYETLKPQSPSGNNS
jgi:starvation-inducible DNA-binding protein